MKTTGWQRKLFIVGVSLVIAIAASGWLAHPTPAQFGSPPGKGTPKGTAGGGSRPANPFCLQSHGRQESLVVMAPTEFVGLTPYASPTVWVYVPNTTAETLEFSLFTQEQVGVYQTNLPITAPGLMKITLPSEVALTASKPYYWTAAVVCNPKQRTEDWVAGGWIQQQPLKTDLQQQLNRATLEQKVKLYAQSDFWYEAFNLYLELRQTQPTNPHLASLWADLLKPSGLSAVMPQEELLHTTLAIQSSPPLR